MQTIKTVFFDIDDTLIDHSGAEQKALLAIKKAYFSSESDSEFEDTWIRMSKKNWELFVAKQLSFEEQRNQRIIDIWSHFNTSISATEAKKVFNEYLKLYEQSWHVFPDVLTTLQSLKKKGVPLGIITNGNEAQQLKKLSQTGILDYFTKKLIVISEAVGHAKPKPEIFNLAESKSQQQTNNLLFIGDSYKSDIAPALSLQWSALLIDRSSKQKSKKTITSLTTILELFE